MSKLIAVLRSVIIAVIISALMLGTTVTIYGSFAKPSFYEHFMDLGNKYLAANKYEEAILEFEKAIQIEDKSTEARVGVAKGAIGIDDVDYAVLVLKEAQSLEPANVELLREIIDILIEVDSEAAYEIMMKYVNRYGKDTLDKDLKDLIETANEDPIMSELVPVPGTYINPITVKLRSTDAKFGHTIYYTTDGSEPDKNATIYRGSIKIEENTTLKLISYNFDGKHTDVYEAYYAIDPSRAEDLQELIDSVKDEIENVKEGNEPGECVAGSKNALENAIADAEKLLDGEGVRARKATAAADLINAELEKFKKNIIPDTNKTKLNNAIKNAQNIINNTVEGTEIGQFPVGSKNKLRNAITLAKKTYDNILATQAEINKAEKDLLYQTSVYDQSRIEEDPIDRTKLQKAIQNAERILSQTTEGTQVGQFRAGAKQQLQNAVNSAKNIYNTRNVTQQQVDEATNKLKYETSVYDQKRITEIDVIIAETGANIGPVTVSLLWNTRDDLDLHVTSPSGDTIYYGNKRGSSGGVLDVDRQAGSFVDNPVENIYWENPPSGNYTVVVNVYTKRSTGSIPFKVRIIKNGEATVHERVVDSGRTTVCTFAY